ncbi:MAG: TrkA C-terminal domain-containing protein, partial [Nitrospinota bacterium]
GGVEMMEIEIVAKSKVTGRPLHKINLPKEILVGGTVEEGNIIFATGDTVLTPGQKVIIIFKSEAVSVVEKFFQ